MGRRLSVHVLIALTACLAACGDAPDQPGALDEPRAIEAAPRREDWWMQRHLELRRDLASAAPRVLFIGDSITQGWERDGAASWEQYFAPLGAANLGLNGDRTENLLWRLHSGVLEGLEPRLAVLMIGTNNAGRDPPSETVAGVLAIAHTLREQLPRTRVLLLALLPRGAGPADPRRWANAEVNRQLREHAASEALELLDFGALFLDDHGDLLRSRMPDLLHPNAEGYRVLAEALGPRLAALLED